MKKPTILILTAWTLHVAAWFLPAIKVPEMQAPVPGWKAFRYASCAIWPVRERPIPDAAPCCTLHDKHGNDAVFRAVVAMGCASWVTVASAVLSVGCGYRLRR
jgi:hypothetical protein